MRNELFCLDLFSRIKKLLSNNKINYAIREFSSLFLKQ